MTGVWSNRKQSKKCWLYSIFVCLCVRECVNPALLLSRLTDNWLIWLHLSSLSASWLSIWAPGNKQPEERQRMSTEQWNQCRNLHARHPVLWEHHRLLERCMHACYPSHIQMVRGHIHRSPAGRPQMNTYTVWQCRWLHLIPTLYCDYLYHYYGIIINVITVTKINATVSGLVTYYSSIIQKHQCFQKWMHRVENASKEVHLELRL